MNATSLMTSLSRVLPNGADSFAYAMADIPTMSFAFVDGYERYHRPTDSVANIDIGSLQHHGEYAAALARHLGDASSIPVGGGETVYFDVLGRALVRYPAWVARLAALATLLALGLYLRVRRATAMGPSALFRSAGWYLASACGAAAGVALLAYAESLVTPAHLLLANPRAFAPAHAIAALSIVLWARARARRAGDTTNLGPVVVWAAASFLLGLFAPAASFVVQIPLLSVVAARGLARWPWAAAFAAIPAALLLTQATGATFLALGADHPAVPAAFLAWSFGGLASALPFRASTRGGASRPSQRFMGGALALTLVFAVVGVLVARGDARTPRADSLLYVVDAQSGVTRWVSFSAALDPFTAPAFGTTPERHPLTSIDPEGDPIWQAPSPPSPSPLPSADVRVERDELRAGRRALTLVVRGAPGTRELMVFAPNAARPRSMTFDGVAPFPLVRFDRELDARLFRMLGGPPSRGVSFSIVAPPADGARIELDLDAAPLDLTVVQKTPGLAVPPPAARPAGYVRSGWSDETWVSTTIRL